MNTGLNWTKILLFLLTTIAIGCFVFTFSESTLITGGSIGVIAISYVVLSYVAARYKNPKFRELIGNYGMPVEPPKGIELISGNARFRDEVLFVHVFPMESGFYFYKGGYCSSIVEWESVRSVAVVQESNRLRAKFVLGSRSESDSDAGGIQEMIVPWDKSFNSVVREKTWLIV